MEDPPTFNECRDLVRAKLPTKFRISEETALDGYKMQVESGTSQGASRVMVQPAGRVQRLSQPCGSGQVSPPLNFTGRARVLRTIEVALCG